jgi:type IV secretion system protein VirD4
MTAREMVKDGGFQIASLAGRFTRITKEIDSIRSAGDTQTRWMLSTRMRSDLKKLPGVHFSQLKRRPTTIYVILPAERMRTHSVWLRLVIVSALRALYRPGGLKTVMLIDEMAALGHLAPLEDAFGLVRGYRVQIVGILQDLNQLKGLYAERWESFLANAGFVHGFAPNDKTTAEWMSWRSGQATLPARSVSESSSSNPGGETQGQTESWNQIGRAHYLPHELFGFAPGVGLLWLAGMENGVRFFAPAYWNMKECDKRWLPNPYSEN